MKMGVVRSMLDSMVSSVWQPALKRYPEITPECFAGLCGLSVYLGIGASAQGLPSQGPAPQSITGVFLWRRPFWSRQQWAHVRGCYQENRMRLLARRRRQTDPEVLPRTGKCETASRPRYGRPEDESDATAGAAQECGYAVLTSLKARSHCLPCLLS